MNNTIYHVIFHSQICMSLILFWSHTGLSCSKGGECYPLYNATSTEYIIPSTDVMHLTLTRKITTTQVVKTSVTVNTNSPIQDYVHPNNHTQPSYEGSSNTYIQTHNSSGIIPYMLFGYNNTQISMLRCNFILG